MKIPTEGPFRYAGTHILLNLIINGKVKGHIFPIRKWLNKLTYST